MPEKDELDVLLDSALATYADPGPDSGLEQRVLMSLAAERAPGQERRARRARWLPWAMAAPVAASLLLWFAISRTVHAPTIQRDEVNKAERTPMPGAGVPANQREPAEKERPSGAKAHISSGQLAARLKPCPDTKLSQPAIAEQVSCREAGRMMVVEPAVVCALPLPKLDVFPTPQPLTRQERALAAMTTQAPAPLRAALAEAQIQDEAPVRIAAIHIPPIEPSSDTQP